MQSDSSNSKKPSLISDYLALAKVRLLALVLVSTGMGYYLAATEGFDLLVVTAAIFGVALVGGGANALNQWYERHIDTLMLRTLRRPLPDNRLSATHAFSFGLVISLFGFLLIGLGVNTLTLLLSFLSWGSYLFLYTPLKRVSALNTWLGAIPGALPATLGCTAATAVVDVHAICLFFILYFWQMPHFFAISWVYQEDYAKGGFKMLSLNDKEGGRTSLHILIHTVLMVIASVSLFVYSASSWVYLLGALVAGIASLVVAIGFFNVRSIENARKVFKLSLIYLPILFLSLILDRLFLS